jgi:3-hydroxy acid dehydrogenase / malonic semialdehyde reductase
MSTTRKIAFITGATSGIGKATAETLAQNNFDLIICGRRKDRLEELIKALSKKTSVYSLCFDVRNRNEVVSSIQSLPGPWKKIDVLINNAGNAHGLAPIHQGDVADWEAMIDINVKGLLYVTKEITPGMVERKTGHIVNIGSIAGKEVYTNGNVYCGSKFAVDAITDGMRMDLNPFGIKVTGLHPGMVDTEFSTVRFKGDTERAKKVYQGMTPLTAQDIAGIILFTITLPAHVVISDMIILPTAQASATIVKRDS